LCRHIYTFLTLKLNLFDKHDAWARQKLNCSANLHGCQHHDALHVRHIHGVSELVSGSQTAGGWVQQVDLSQCVIAQPELHSDHKCLCCHDAIYNYRTSHTFSGQANNCSVTALGARPTYLHALNAEAAIGAAVAVRGSRAHMYMAPWHMHLMWNWQ
jgi:hypothetical protein